MAYGRGDGLGLSSGLLAAIFIAFGVGLAGVMIAGGLVESRVADRHVSVEGAAEREVKADLAVWPLTIAANDRTLATAQGRIDEQLGQVEAFLSAAGFDAAELNRGVLQLDASDAPLPALDPEAPPAPGVYRLEQSLTVRSQNVDLVALVSRQLGDLARQGVAVSSPRGPAFLYTRLTDIRADLMSEAALDARDAAAAFADQAGAQLGGVRTAVHGEVEVLPRDAVPGDAETDAIFKRVRMVSQVTYQLQP